MCAHFGLGFQRRAARPVPSRCSLPGPVNHRALEIRGALPAIFQVSGRGEYVARGHDPWRATARALSTCKASPSWTRPPPPSTCSGHHHCSERFAVPERPPGSLVAGFWLVLAQRLGGTRPVPTAPMVYLVVRGHE